MLNGKPGYINFLDALNSWQLVQGAEGAPPACPPPPASSMSAPPAPPWACRCSDVERKIYFVGRTRSCTPHRLRLCPGPGRRPAVLLRRLGGPVATCATPPPPGYLQHEVSDGIIAPGYTDEALEILKTKRKGNYNVVQIDPDYVPAAHGAQGRLRRHLRAGPQQLSRSTSDLLANIVTENKDLPRAAPSAT